MDKKIIPSVVLISIAILMIFSAAYMRLEQLQFAKQIMLTGMVSEIAGLLWLFTNLKQYYRRAI